MYFFTDINTKFSNYCLLHFDHYNDERKYNKSLVYVDPGIKYLTKMDDYPNVEKMHYLIEEDLLRENEWISIDYPTDEKDEMVEEYIERTYLNNLKYQHHAKYICTVQFEISDCYTANNIRRCRGKPEDFWSFKENLDRLFPILKNPNKILGIGNICRIFFPTDFTDLMIQYLIKIRNKVKSRRIHFYGLAIRLIKKYVPMLEQYYKVSTDSTKWTRSVNKRLKDKYGVNFEGENQRKDFFYTYMQEIRDSGVHVLY